MTDILFLREVSASSASPRHRDENRTTLFSNKCERHDHYLTMTGLSKKRRLIVPPNSKKRLLGLFPVFVAVTVLYPWCNTANGFQTLSSKPTFWSQCFIPPNRKFGVRFVSSSECCGPELDLMPSTPRIREIQPIFNQDDGGGGVAAEETSSPSIYHCRFPDLSKTTNKKNLWKTLIPPPSPPLIPNIQRNHGTDVTIEWSNKDDPLDVAEVFINQCLNQLPDYNGGIRINQRALEDHIERLAWSLRLFQEFVAQELSFSAIKRGSLPNADTRFKARIVASRGAGGTKCPQFHIDHVPIRWIESLVGRGCDTVLNNGSIGSSGEDGVNWDAVNGLDEDDVADVVEDRNKKLVDPKVANIYCAREGEAMLLVGNRWDEFAKNKPGSRTNTWTQPAVHKSPSPIPFWEGRVLLTQDVIL